MENLDPSHELPVPSGLSPDHELPSGKEKLLPKPSFLERYPVRRLVFIVIPAVLVIVGVGSGLGLLYYNKNTPRNCQTVEAYATDPKTGVCMTFGTPCDIPKGWGSCSLPTPTSNPAADLKTYKKQNIFTISYPPDWSVIENQSNDSVITFLDKTSLEDSDVIVRIDLAAPATFKSEMNRELWSESQRDTETSRVIGKSTVEGYPAIQIETMPNSSNPSYSVATYVFHPRLDVVITLKQLTDSQSSEEFKNEYFSLYDRILSTFKFLDGPTCTPRPACLDSEPRCLIPETSDMCPPTTQVKNPDNQVICTTDAKLCPDGSYVSRQGPNCEFSPCR